MLIQKSCWSGLHWHRGDYNGVPWTPVGLEDVSKYPNVFAALIEDQEYEWTDEDLAKVANK